jgi:ribosomal protein L44E
MICERCGIGYMHVVGDYYDRTRKKWILVYRCDYCGHKAKYDRQGNRVYS